MASPLAFEWPKAVILIENEWQKHGTGFLVARATSGNIGKIFLITNKHLIYENQNYEKTTKILYLFLNNRKNTKPRKEKRKIPITQNMFRIHPEYITDVVAIDVTELVKEKKYELKWITYDLIATKEIIQNKKITIGDEIIVIGYPTGLNIQKNEHHPIFRNGIIASNINDALLLEKNKQIKGFFIDSAIIPGSSGSPVVLKPNMYKYDGNKWIMGDPLPPYLLGIVSSANYFSFKIGEKLSYQLSNLGVVFTSETIKETIERFFSK